MALGDFFYNNPLTTPGLAASAFGREPVHNFLFGTPETTQQINRYTPEQQNVFSTMLGQGRQGLNTGQVNLGPIEQQARRQFETQTVPSLAERFTAAGQNRLGSGGFAGQLGAAGAGLEQGLAGLRYDKLQQLLQGGLTPQYDTQIQQSQPGLAHTLLQYLPLILGGAFGGPIGAGIGGAAGSGLSNLFGNSQNNVYQGQYGANTPIRDIDFGINWPKF